MDDAQIIELFFSRSEQAISETDKKYGAICQKISYNILNNRQDAEECVNDTYFGVWNVIPPESPNPLLAFLSKIVRNISLKRHRHNTAEKRNSTYDATLDEIENWLSPTDTLQEEMEAKELAKLIEEFLDHLSAENRVIFIRRYWFFDTYSSIAEQVSITEKNVSVRLARMRKQLRETLLMEGVTI